MKLATASRPLLLLTTALSTIVRAQQFGVDCSFPIHSTDYRCPDGVDMRHRQVDYQAYLQGCRDSLSPKKAGACDSTEQDRLEMSLLQPQSMVNYTDTGFKKIRAPQELRDILNQFWKDNKENKGKEVWSTGNIYVNHWKSPTYFASVEDTKLIGGGMGLKNRIWEAARPTVEEWTGMELRPTSLYGIRVYTQDAVLSPHVDRLPLVSSCIINVDQDVDEPWPLEVIDRQGNAVNVTMEPGDMVLYESGSLLHARPYPLQGRFFANIFIHFEPTGRRLWDDDDEVYLDALEQFYPPYLLPDSPWLSHWKRANPQGWSRPAPSAPQQHSQISPTHHAAAAGDLEHLRLLLKTTAGDKTALLRRDENGWQPLHEAVRAGHAEIVAFLVDEAGANVNARAGLNQDGASPLNMAVYYHGGDHVVTQLLRQRGALDLAETRTEL